MSINKINVGTAANDGTGDTLRAAMQKVNSNYDQTQSDTVALTAGTWEAITFATAFATADYQLTCSGWDSDGNQIVIRRRNVTASGFEARAAVNCDLEYTATKK